MVSSEYAKTNQYFNTKNTIMFLNLAHTRLTVF